MGNSKKYNTVHISRIEAFVWFAMSASILLLMLMSYSNFKDTYKQTISSTKSQYRTVAESCANKINARLEKQLAILDTLASTDEVMSMDNEVHHAFFKDRTNRYGFVYFFIIDNDGNAYYIDEDLVRHQNDSVFFSNLSANEHYISDPFFRADMNQLISTLCVAIHDTSGNRIGTLCGVIDLIDVSDYVNSYKGHTNMGVVSSSGTYVASNENDFAEVGRNIFDIYKDFGDAYDFLVSSFGTTKTKCEIATAPDVEYILCISDIASCHWKVCLAYRLTDAVRPVKKLYTSQLYIIFWALLTAFLLIHILRGYIKREISNFVDALTGVGNRARCDMMLETFIKKDTDIMLVCFDINDFKYINDTFGHDCGDIALKIFADILLRSFGQFGFVGRMGGDEFIVLLEGNVNKSYHIALDRMHLLLNRFNSRNASSTPFKLSTSYGKAIRRSNEMSITVPELYNTADQNMYACKQRMKSKK